MSPASSRRARSTAPLTACTTCAPGRPGGPGRPLYPTFLAAGAGGVNRTATGQARPSLMITGAAPRRAAIRAVSIVADITSRRRSGRNADADVEGESQREVGVEVALVELVEDHEADPGERRVLLQAAGEDPFRHDLDAGVGPTAPFVPGAIADGAADLLAEQVRHTPGGSPGRQSPRFQHDDAPSGQPRLVEQPQGHDRRLARPRRRLQHGLSFISQRRPQAGTHSSIGSPADCARRIVRQNGRRVRAASQATSPIGGRQSTRRP